MCRCRGSLEEVQRCKGAEVVQQVQVQVERVRVAEQVQKEAARQSIKHSRFCCTSRQNDKGGGQAIMAVAGFVAHPTKMIKEVAR